MNDNQLTENERNQIYAMNKAGHSQKETAELLGRSASTNSRALRRNRGLRGYRPAEAQRFTQARCREAHKARKIMTEVRGWIATLIRQELSPAQVVDYLARHKHLSLHHETVYRLIYEDKAAGGALYTHLRVASRPYRKRYGHYDRRGRLKNRVAIDERPAIVESRRRIGDWEGDTILGKGGKSALLTRLERKTLYTVIMRLTGKQSALLAKAAVEGMEALTAKILTITLDNGLEFAGHEVIAQGLGADIYFAHPYASWERGTNENTHGLIRQYFPKGTDFNQVSDEQIKQVMERLNNRPRKTRESRSPNELFMGQQADPLAA